VKKFFVVVASGGALAFALAGVAGAGVAWGSAHPAGAAHAKLVRPDGTPVIRDAMAKPGDPPIIRRSDNNITFARAGDPCDGGQIT
jgi:hypothetical protein